MRSAPRGPEGGARILAPAKVNLYLHVVGRRADGMHLLDSLVVFADLADELSVAPADDLSLAVDGPFADRLAVDEDNLVLRAARRLQAARAVGGGAAPGAALRLTKRLPVASGIGGGSADAAATLRLLAPLWRPALGPSELAAIGETIGADVAVCLAAPQPSFVGGIGERVEPAPPLPACWLVLANPNRPLATSAVFKARRGPFSEPSRWSGPLPGAEALARALLRRRNDLTDAARGLMPEIDAVLAALAATPGCLLARMSGSGATCFGLYGEAAGAAAAAGRLAGAHPGWWVRSAALLGTGA